MSWTAVRDAIQAAVAAGSGLPSSSIIWAYQNVDAPALPYVEIKISPVGVVGQDYLTKKTTQPWKALTAYNVGDIALNDSNKTYQCAVAGTSAGSGGPTGTTAGIVDGTVTWNYLRPAGQEISQTTSGVREVVVEATCFTSSTDGSNDSTDAIALAEQIKGSLLLNSVRDPLGVAGVSPFDPQPVQYMPDIPNTLFRGRAIAPIRCYVPAQAYAEYVTYIQTVRGTISTTGGGVPGVTSTPYQAP